MVKKQHIYVGLLVILMIVLTVFAWQMTIQAWPSNEELTFLKAFLYYQSYIMPFFLALVIWGFRQKQVSKSFMLIAMVGCVVGIYARFIEPNVLLVKESKIKALISWLDNYSVNASKCKNIKKKLTLLFTIIILSMNYN